MGGAKDRPDPASAPLDITDEGTPTDGHAAEGLHSRLLDRLAASCGVGQGHRMILLSEEDTVGIERGRWGLREIPLSDSASRSAVDLVRYHQSLPVGCEEALARRKKPTFGRGTGELAGRLTRTVWVEVLGFPSCVPFPGPRRSLR